MKPNMKKLVAAALVVGVHFVVPAAEKQPTLCERCLAAADVVMGKTATKEERLKAADLLCREVNPRFGVWTTCFYEYYCMPENWPDAAIAKLEKAFWVAAKLQAQEQGEKSFKPWYTLAEACLFKEQYDYALKSYDKALEHFKAYTPKDAGRLGKDFAKCLYGRANALMGLGRKDEAKAALEDYLSRDLPPFGGRGEEPIHSYARVAIQDMEGGDLDRMRMPRFTGAKAYPEPQQAVYSEDFVPVSGYDLEVRGLEPNDRRLELLDVKFARFGAPKRKDAGFKVSVAVDPATKAFDGLKDKAAFAAFRAKKFAARTDNADGKAVDTSPKEFCDYMENEAYVLEVTKEGAKIVAMTKQGALWGIVSLIQLWDQERHAIRLAKIRDWPDVAVRGYLGYFWAGTLEFTLFNKMNSVCHQKHPCFENTFRPVNWYIEAFMGQQFHDFGLELFFGNCWMTHAPQLPMCSPRTLPLRISVCKRYASAHIGVYYPLDDVRYPICPQDLKAYGDQIGAIDGQHQNAIFQAVVKEYPDWRFIVCPPPYMGPDGRYRNAESRDHYLAAWSKELDPRIEAYWTGPRVKSYRYEQYHNDWVLKAYGRRPYLFQNGIAWHNLEHYTVDDIGWPSMYCDGTLDKVLKGYHLNSGTPQCTPRISTLADALWNIGGYVAARATERGLAQVSGEKMFSLLRPGLDDLSYFDKYKYGDTDDRVDLEDGEALERRALNVETCWSNATAYAKSIGVPIYGTFGRGVGWMRKVMNRFRNPPDFAKVHQGQLKDIRDIAFQATSFDLKKGHTFVSPVDVSGGAVELVKRSPRGSREWAKERGVLYRVLKRQGTGRSSGSLRFTCETFPPGCDYKLQLCATTAGKPANIRLSVNGTKFFEGDPKTGTDPFKPVLKTFAIPEKLLKRNNLVTIENLTPGTDAESSEDCYRIRYAVVRAEVDAAGIGQN